MKFLKGLNPRQKEAVEHGDGPLLILAGAGSGKTKTVTHRIAHLIHARGVSPSSILAVTFTNKAAGEMRQRVETLLGRSVRGMWISTFHSMCARMLREHIDLLGFSKSFNIIDSSDSINLIKTCMKDLGISERLYSPRAVASRISVLKGRIVTPEEFASAAHANPFDSKVAKIYPVYQERLKASNALDFDDMLMLTVLLFTRHPKVLAKYTKLFDHLLVDEYQDTNPAQYKLIRLLAGKKNCVCVVGDDDQSIYRFRGADLRNILDFEKDFPSSKVVKLEQNYRSTQCILDASWSLVCNNPGRKPKKLWTDVGQGDKVHHIRLADEAAEAVFIADTVGKETSEGRSLNEYAVLYRTNTQARTIEEALAKKGIPYRVIGGMKFFDRKEIKDIICYLKVIANPTDSVSLKRIVNTPPRGIGEATLKKAAQLSLPDNLPLMDSLERLLEDEGLAGGPKRSIKAFLELMNGFMEAKGSLGPSGMARKVIDDTRYLTYLRDSLDLEAESKTENINEMLSSIEDFEEAFETTALEDYLTHASLLTDWDTTNADRQAVTLMTLHLSKGLEFPVVFIAGVEEGLIPHAHSNSSDAEVEEERRLMYVGMTRAKERLYLLNAVTRRLAGLTQSNRQSRFLEELPDELVVCKKVGIAKKPTASAFPGVVQFCAHKKCTDGPARCTYKTGSKVSHPVWGQGVVEKTEGKGEELKVTVQFKSVGKKKLMARMANLTLG
jgi:ATP-dependent DNA helicase UvrD/PcrA